MLSFISALLLSALWVICTGTGDWCYQSQITCDSHCLGPDEWDKVNSDCKLSRQSPINIVTKKTKLSFKLRPLKFQGYQNVFDSLLKNNGHTVQLEIPNQPAISGGNLSRSYEAFQLHFHWGENGGPGSEHTIDGEQYPMELHIVHKRKDLKTIQDAVKEPNGLAVLGFFYVESEYPNQKYNGLIQAVQKVINPNEKTSIKGISLSNIILSEEVMNKYYRYEGSLTTPDCSEAVIWTVFENPIFLSKSQLSVFSTLKFSDGKPMVKNFRPLQKRLKRTVYRSGTVGIHASFLLLLGCVSMTLGLSQSI